jgi:uncharacterized protein YbaR (Trm112 family)
MTYWQTWGIRPTDLVLEIGSGGQPCPRSDILCDKYYGDPTERYGRPLVHDRPLVIGDALNLPFRPDTFDFVISAHLLEHLEAPDQFVSQLTKVAKRGCIVTPSSLWEKMVGVPTHRWIVSIDGDTLVLSHKQSPVIDPEISNFFHNICDYPDLLYLAQQYHDCLNITYFWKDEIKYRIEGKPPKEMNGFVSAQVDRHLDPAKHQDTLTENLRRGVKSILSRWVRGRWSWARKPPLQQLLACPICQSQVRLDKAAAIVECCDSGHRFPVIGSVPVMLAESVL